MDESLAAWRSLTRNTLEHVAPKVEPSGEDRAAGTVLDEDLEAGVINLGSELNPGLDLLGTPGRDQTRC
jgi:hypothetical protein